MVLELEATPSIDTRTEEVVQADSMDNLMKGRTVFAMIGAPPSTVRNSDVIMVLDHGRIIERGARTTSSSRRRAYYQLYTVLVELE